MTLFGSSRSPLSRECHCIDIESFLLLTMPSQPMPSHCEWFIDTGRTLSTVDGQVVKIIEFQHLSDEAVLAEWALHLRRHYASDHELVENSRAMGMSKSDYLREIKFPNTIPPGPSVLSGDFSEILIADYIQFLLNFNVPRTRYDRKSTQNESVRGTDILAFKLNGTRVSRRDELLTVEVKGALKSNPRGSNPFQNAIRDSIADFETRLPLALNATLQRLKDRGEMQSAQNVERFMNKIAHPYKHTTGAFVVCSNNSWRNSFVTQANANHPNSNTFFLAVTGADLMDLAKQLYEIAYASA